jgi:hypothetical protein
MPDASPIQREPLYAPEPAAVPAKQRLFVNKLNTVLQRADRPVALPEQDVTVFLTLESTEKNQQETGRQTWKEVELQPTWGRAQQQFPEKIRLPPSGPNAAGSEACSSPWQGW